MKVFQSSSFAKKVKKLKAKQKQHLDAAIKDIIPAPHIGVEKRGDLKGVFVYKFKIQGVLYLLSYRFLDEDLELIMLGPHENYYRNLKSYFKEK
ncbi:type II toxin-antitoxin system RelE/ParE family toxin [Desulfofustis glycolicus]|uniref:ParE-like toxin of type II toxin-antitoxin system n=1 Tax=Desulfofustis glycolicus DSM 9705 TaxID=1121409 RepID=A0A1M5XAE4_9BACT|nr:type II toxin-antitoxin system RelE/ParE family toxin [Desulfofustis glycolicus]MCB2218192.1 type II toxin-antitoxin system RelE/ParE family toxin [Desulfobulbaceae bacterium]SHH96771.1 ParE-like toxin of type II toxin-antitoxin system [Desulfofustis glycolicus DSM 9705]